MGRILAIDYGVRRTGIAVTDSLQIIANALTTVDTKQLLDFLKEYTRREEVELFVVGLPKQTNGLDSDNLPRVRSFVGQLKKALPDIPVEWWDERYTSVMAHHAMLESGIGKKARQNKALVDEISACIILQGYMESRRFVR
ncbi:MAG: Holliday junction resolvase RuvX [Bacteroidaceae bacterium]|nr:Holliday junction resolvase RuvX [Bacteroidaceae bacterium]MDE6159499.1 Holliday junction resolvase RuvX [Bacteroidaceae bacterium]